MTAPLFRLPVGTLAGRRPDDVVTLDGAEGHHAARVHRLRPGQEVLVADGSGLVGHARVRHVHAGVVEAVLTDLAPGADTPTRPGPRFVLVQALIKGARADTAVEAATELGVDEIVAWQAERCVVVWRDDRAERALAKWAAAAGAAAKQSRRATSPVLTGPLDTATLERRIRAGALTLVLHEQAIAPLAGAVLPDEGEVLVVVGPEGGISDAELTVLTRAGAAAVRLGPHVLRSGTAGPAALAVLSALTRWRA